MNPSLCPLVPGVGIAAIVRQHLLSLALPSPLQGWVPIDFPRALKKKVMMELRTATCGLSFSSPRVCKAALS